MRFPKSANAPQGLGNLWRVYLSTQKLIWNIDHKLAAGLAISSIITGLLNYPRILITKAYLDTIVAAIKVGSPQPYFLTLIWLTLGNLAISQIDSYLNNYSGNSERLLNRILQTKVGINIARKLNTIPVSEAEKPEVRDLSQRVNDNLSSLWRLQQTVSNIPETFFTIVSTLIPLITYLPLSIIPAIILAIPDIIIGNKYAKIGYAIRSKNAALWRLWTAFEDFTLKGRYLYENKILRHTEILFKRENKIAHRVFLEDFKLDLEATRKRQGTRFVMDLFELITTLYLFTRAAYQTISLGTAQIAIQSIRSFIGRLSFLIRQCSSLVEDYLFIQDYEKLMSIPDEEPHKGVHFPARITYGLEFRHVWFKYGQNPHWTIKDISFVLDPTDNLAIVGQNGAGKSTLIKLICRFYQPQRGEILLNGKNINDYSLSEYQHHLSALFQDFAQYPFNARDNIAFGDIIKKSAISDIRQAAKLTGIDDFILSLPHKYKNSLDKEFKGGIEPSKGQWQRIALARALYRDSVIIILDEPTSNVDPESEEEIFQRLLRVAQNKMVILVSHRFSTVRRADKILVLEDGRVIEYDNHTNLIRHRGRYHQLFTAQAKNYQQ